MMYNKLNTRTMKKNMFKFGCLALMGLGMAACSEEALEIQKVAQVGKKGITIEAKSFVNENDTRANYTFGSEGVELEFNSDDVIGVWGMRDGIKEQVSFHVSDAATEGMSATFDGGLWRLREDETKYAAFYPYDQFNCGADINRKVYVFVDYSWSIYNGSDPVYSSLSYQDYMVSTAVSAEDGNATFTLEHVGAIVSVRLTGLPVNTEVSKLTITSSANDFTIRGKIYVGETFSGIVPSDYDGQTNSLSVDCVSVYSDANGEAIIYFMCAPTDLTGKTVTITATCDGMPYVCEKTNITTIEAGHVKQLVAEMTADMSGVQELEVGDNTIDLDANGWYFVPTTTGIYTTSDEFTNFSGAYSMWDATGAKYILIAGQTYGISELNNPSLTISLVEEITIKTLSVGTTEIDDESWYSFSVEEGDYNFETMNANASLLPSNYVHYFSNITLYTKFDVFGDPATITIEKLDLSDATPISVGTTEVESDTWYKVSIDESGVYNISCVNGYGNNLPSGLFTIASPQTFYSQFTVYGDPVTITIEKLDLSTATPLSVGTEATVSAGQLYSVELTADTNYDLNTSESLRLTLNDTDGSMVWLNSSYTGSCWTTATYYFVAESDATFTITVAE